ADGRWGGGRRRPRRRLGLDGQRIDLVRRRDPDRRRAGGRRRRGGRRALGRDRGGVAAERLQAQGVGVRLGGRRRGRVDVRGGGPAALARTPANWTKRSAQVAHGACRYSSWARPQRPSDNPLCQWTRPTPPRASPTLLTPASGPVARRGRRLLTVGSG